MGKLDLRPLSVGEILDRTFTLYRGNFILFAGISAIPHILTLALSLAQVMFVIPAAGLSASGSSSTVPLWLQSGSAFIAFASVAMLGVVAMSGSSVARSDQDNRRVDLAACEPRRSPEI